MKISKSFSIDSDLLEFINTLDKNKCSCYVNGLIRNDINSKFGKNKIILDIQNTEDLIKNENEKLFQLKDKLNKYIFFEEVKKKINSMRLNPLEDVEEYLSNKLEEFNSKFNLNITGLQFQDLSEKLGINLNRNL